MSFMAFNSTASLTGRKSRHVRLRPAPSGLNGCNPDFINIELTATKKFGKWEFGPVAFGSTDLTNPIAGYQKQSQFAAGGLFRLRLWATHSADLFHHGRGRE